jgi:hypothetical protein
MSKEFIVKTIKINLSHLFDLPLTEEKRIYKENTMSQESTVSQNLNFNTQLSQVSIDEISFDFSSHKKNNQRFGGNK